MKRELIEDMLLFNNDLREYKVSIEGKFVLACYDIANVYHVNDIVLCRLMFAKITETA